MRGIDRLFIIFLLFILVISSVSAYTFDVPQEVKDKSELVTLRMREEVEVGNLTLKYEKAEAVYTSILVKENDQQQYFSSDGSGIATQFIPLWTNDIVIHIEKIGAEGTEDLNYVTDDSEITVWVEDNARFILSCGEFIEEPKNIGLNTGNFYSNGEEFVRHKFTKSYYYPPEIHFSYAFDIVYDSGIIANLRIYEGENYETPVETIPFSGCGDTTFTYNDVEFLIQPYYYMENGNWDVSIREINRICPKNIPNPPLTAIRPSSIKIISLGLYDDIRKPLSNLSAKNVEKFGSSSVKVDFKGTEGDWETYIFDDCGWKTVGDDSTIRLAGLYGKEAEFYVVTSPENYPPANRYNPFWDRILEILGFY